MDPPIKIDPLAGMSDYYTLDGHTPVKCDLLTWARMIEDRGARQVQLSIRNGVHVSTVFLGIDHGWGPGPRPPILFETMIFGGEHNDYQTRCATWEQAERMHRDACRLVWGTKLKIVGGSDE
jgi:hypothetical protein